MNEEIAYISRIIGYLLKIREVDKIREDLEREYSQLKERKISVGKRDGRILDVTMEINGKRKKLRKKIIHGRRLEPIYGSDIAIEFPKEKTVFIQWKRVNSKGRFNIRRDQLLTLLKLCRVLCRCRRYCWNYPFHFCLPIKCGATYYALIFSDEEIGYIRACDMSFILGIRRSVSEEEVISATIPEWLFREKIFTCEIGCKDLPEWEKGGVFEDYCTIARRVLFLFEIR